jgi:hypothetical protein
MHSGSATPPLVPSKASGNEKVAAPESVTAALSAFATSFAEATKATGPTPDHHVSVAFALGWHMAELYRPTVWRKQAPEQGDDLPGLSELSAKAHSEIGLDEVEVALNRLKQPITENGLLLPSVDETRKALTDDPMDPVFREKLFDFHVLLLSVLTAASFKLGTAYELGRSLADTCNKPTALGTLKEEFDEHRIATLRSWLADLTSVLPAHAGQSVNGSLPLWGKWVLAQESLDGKDLESAIRLLRRQGESWRALLAGEKAGTDLLKLDNYIAAGAGVLKRMSTLTWHFLRQFWPAVALVLLLFLGGLALIVWDQSSGHIAAGIGTLVTSIGLTWKGVGASLGKTAAKLEHPLWEAQLDVAITTALTLRPGSERVVGYTPPLTSAERTRQLEAGSTPPAGRQT